ncbi:MAG: serine/threonine protein kinase [Cyanobacteria bacterium SZAS-4]|nr:serine/threonine protein kinase [Cyanobacteria bacterium SZAS-4]
MDRERSHLEPTPLERTQVEPNQPERARLQNYQTRASQLAAELPPQYELFEKVGEGGMGFIFKARNRYTHSLYAVKVLRSEFDHDQRALDRFMFEAKAASSLKHPRICCVHDFGLTASGIPYLVMDWIEGISLGRKVSRDKQLSVSNALEIFQQIAAALMHSHQNKVVHRDLKPENIMLGFDEQGRTAVHLLDFGIAKMLSDEDVGISGGLTRSGTVIGTPLYMSPEQARGLTIDRRSDIYSLGCVMYFTLTGVPPFLGKSVIDIITMHINAPPPEMDPALKIPADLKMIILKAMEKSPSDRYQSVEELALDLGKLNRGVSIERRMLAGERQLVKKKIVIVACFILGFIAMYAASIGLQNLLDASSNASSPEQTKHASTHKTAPKKEH